MEGRMEVEAGCVVFRRVVWMVLRVVLADAGSEESRCFVAVESVFKTSDDLSSLSNFEFSELSIFMTTGPSETEVAFVWREEVLEQEESLPDSSEVEEYGRVLVKSSGLEPPLDVIWSINRSLFFLGGSEVEFASMLSNEALPTISVSNWQLLFAGW
jgi:hypothetical protein